LTLKNLHILSVEDIPKEVKDCPIDNLLSLYALCLEMERVCEQAGGVGLSAVQVGIPWKLYIVKYEKGYRYFVNCEYEAIGEKIESLEGCLSLRKQDHSLRYFEVKRFERVCITGHELLIEEKPKLGAISVEFSGVYAIIHQHEIDHSGLVTIDQIGVEVDIWR
jgi:peptide deformylase